jgi:hypothetical protein
MKAVICHVLIRLHVVGGLTKCCVEITKFAKLADPVTGPDETLTEVAEIGDLYWAPHWLLLQSKGTLLPQRSVRSLRLATLALQRVA